MVINFNVCRRVLIFHRNSIIFGEKCKRQFNIKGNYRKRSIKEIRCKEIFDGEFTVANALKI